MAIDRLAVYYHMPCHAEDTATYANPVIGTFVDSLTRHFRTVILLAPALEKRTESINYRLGDGVAYVSLGAVDPYCGHFGRMRRLRRVIRQRRDEWDVLLLRAPSPRAHAIWRYAGKPRRTVLFLVGNVTPSGHSNFRGVLGALLIARSRWLAHGLRRIAQRGEHLILANSASLRRYWQRYSSSPVALVHTSSLAAAHMSARRESSPFSARPYRLVFVGRVCLDKGIAELLAAVSTLNQGTAAPFRLDVVGPIADMGDLTLDERIRRCGVEGAVTYHGSVPFGSELLAFYRRADAFVLPSYHEGMPKTVWEAMSQGTPVIATAVGGMGDFLRDGQDAILIEPKNAQAIVTAVRRLTNDVALAETLSRAGLLTARSMTREAQAQRIAELVARKWGSQ